MEICGPSQEQALILAVGVRETWALGKNLGHHLWGFGLETAYQLVVTHSDVLLTSSVWFWGMGWSTPGPGKQRAFAKLALVMHGNSLVGLSSPYLFPVT